MKNEREGCTALHGGTALYSSLRRTVWVHLSRVDYLATFTVITFPSLITVRMMLIPFWGCAKRLPAMS